MKTLVKIAFLSAAALTITGIAHADHRDYRIALANKSLSDIVKELTDKAGVQALVNPETKSKLEYE